MDTQQKHPSEIGFKELFLGLKVIFRYTIDYRKDLYILTALTLALAVFTAITPYVWGLVIDSILGNQTTIPWLSNNTPVILSVWFAAILISSILDWAKNLRGRKIEQLMSISYEATVYNHLFKLPMGFHKTHRTGEVREKIMRAYTGINNVFTNVILDNIPDLCILFLSLILISSIKPIFSIVFIIGIVACTYIAFRELKYMAIGQREFQEQYKKARGIMGDSLTNIRIVKDFVTEKYEYNRVIHTLREIAFPAWYKFFKTTRTTGFVQNIIAALVRVIIFGLSVYYIHQGTLTIGQMLTIISLLSFTGILNLVNTRFRLQNAIIAIEEGEQILKEPIEIYHPEQGRELKAPEGKITFDSVTFGYDSDKPVLQNISFKINPGETVALVGESGVGKSTLIELICGYYAPQDGAVQIDDVDVNLITLDSLRRNIATVSQEITLFNDTIKANIAYGSFNATEEQIIEAARQAHCLEFIEKFPQQWEQKVGERGLKLSVGQKQRVAIARAILKNPKILILDEPTSALDAKSEKIITEALNTLMEGKTTIIVAHRLSTVRKADKIVVFKGGNVVEIGTHTELLKIKDGVYKHLHELQHTSEKM